MPTILPTTSGIYLLTSGAVTYVGATTNLRLRIQQHQSKLRHGKFEGSPYRQLKEQFEAGGLEAIEVTVLEECVKSLLAEREVFWMRKLRPTANQFLFRVEPLAFTPEERQRKAERVKAKWAQPEYRERAVTARKGNAFAKGYKCTPEQVENRKRAARISNTKRNFGEVWREEYARRYPEHVGDV